MKRGAILALAILAIAAGVSMNSRRERVPPSSAPSQPVADAATQENDLPRQAAAPAQNSERLSAERFATRLQETLETLPTRAQLQELSDEELHGTPTLIIQGAVKLGEIAQVVHDQPELADVAHEFYARCAQDSKLVSSIRTVCAQRMHTRSG